MLFTLFRKVSQNVPMNMNVSKTNGVKLLAAVMVMAMVFAGAAVVLSDSEVNAAPVQNDLYNVSGGSLPDNATYSDSTKTLTLTGYTGKGFYSNTDLTIKISGSNTIEADRAGEYAGNAYSAIYATGKITIEADDTNDASVVDSLAIKVTGVSTQTGVSESTYGIYATGGIDITGVAIDIDVSTNDPLAFAIAGNGASKFTKVTGSIDGGNRAIQVGNYAFTFTGCDLTLTGGEKAIQAKNENSHVTISSGTIRALLNPNYGGPQIGDNDGFGVKATKLTVSSGATLISDGIRISSEEGTATASIEGNVTINDYSYAFSSDVSVEGYTPGFTMDAKSTTTIGSTGKVVNNSTIISKGTLTNEGNLINNGTINNQSDNFMNNGKLAMSNDATFTGEAIKGNAITSSITESDTSTGLQNYIDSDFTIPSGGAYLTQNLTIKSGATLTVPSKAELNLNGFKAELNLNGFKLIVEGTLAVERNGVVAALPTGTGQGIYLASNGAIQNEGVIGTAKTPVTVGVWTNNAVDANAGSVELLNVNGVNFSIVKDGVGAKAEYYLNVNGDVSRASGTTSKDTMTFTINGATVKGDLTVSKDVTLAGTFNVDRNSTVTVNGPLTADVTLKNGASITVNGIFDDEASIIAETAEGIAADAENPTLGKTTITDTTDTTEKVSATGFTVSVSRVQYTDDNGDVKFNQRAYLSGNIDTIAVNSDDKPGKDATAELTVSGNIFVAADTTVVLDNVVLATAASSGSDKPAGLIIVDGTIQNVGEAPDFSFVGAYYSVTAEGETDGVGYITSFDKAMGAIATADDMTITVSGKGDFYTEVTGTYELAMDQTIELNDGSDAYIAIAESGKITVNDGAVLDPKALKEIDGLLVVMDGGNCPSSTPRL